MSSLPLYFLLKIFFHEYNLITLSLHLTPSKDPPRIPSHPNLLLILLSSSYQKTIWHLKIKIKLNKNRKDKTNKQQREPNKNHRKHIQIQRHIYSHIQKYRKSIKTQTLLGQGHGFRRVSKGHEEVSENNKTENKGQYLEGIPVSTEVT